MHWFFRFLCCILRCGPLPAHFSVIMDGNRRYARSHNLPSLSGHLAGYSALLQVLEWCRELGVRSASVFAFSIDNFLRPASEVRQLMDLVVEKLQELVERIHQIHSHAIDIRMLGNVSLLPPDVQRCIAAFKQQVRQEKKSTQHTQQQTTTTDSEEGVEEQHPATPSSTAEKEAALLSTSSPSPTAAPSAPGGDGGSGSRGSVFVNLCVAYHSQQEMTDAAALIAKALQASTTPPLSPHQRPAAAVSTSPASSLSRPPSSSPPALHPLDVTPALYQSCLYTGSLPPSLCRPSLLLRTSGEHRLSDYQLCQLLTTPLSWIDKSSTAQPHCRVAQ